MFNLGMVVLTVGANDLDRSFINECLLKHKSGDFGTVGEDSIEINKESIANKCDDVLSMYTSASGEEIFIKTELYKNDSENTTTVLLCDEY